MEDNTPADGGQAPLFQHSWQIIAHIIQHVEIPTAQKITLIALAHHANRNKGWVAWPSQATLQIETGLSNRGVRSALDGLVNGGWITKTRRKGQTGLANDHTLNIGAISAVKSTLCHLMPEYSGDICRSNVAPAAGVNRHEVPTNRLSSTDHPNKPLEQASQSKSMSIAPSGAAVQAPPSKKAPKEYPQGPQISAEEAKRIIQTIPKRLYGDLRMLHVMAQRGEDRSKDLQTKLEAEFDRLVLATIRFRGIPRDPEWEGYTEQDWTAVFWYTAKRTLEGRWQGELSEVGSPAKYLNDVADNAHWTDDAGPYSDAAHETVIQQHNQALK